MKRIALALACATVAGMALPTAAQTQSGRILKSVTTQDLERAMTEIGGSATMVDALEDGDPAMRIDFSNGVVASAEFNCNDTDGCTGLSLIAYFTRNEDTSIAQAQAATQQFDWGRAAISAGLDDNNNMYV